MIPTGSLNITPTLLDIRGNNAILSWVSPYATSATLNNGIGILSSPTSGSMSLFVFPTTTYRITFTNSDGSYVASASITAVADSSTSNADGSILANVFRNIGGGVIAVNNARLSGDGMPSYHIRSKFVPYVLPPTTIQYLYTYSTGNIYVWDVRDVNSPSLAATVFLGTNFPSVCVGILADVDYLYLRSTNGGRGNIRILSLANPLNPTIVSTLPLVDNEYVGGMVVRRRKATYNNLLFTSDGGTWTIRSFDITDPTNPILKSSYSVGAVLPSVADFSFDPIQGRLFWCELINWGGRYGYVNVANDGTLSAGADYYLNIPVSGGFLYGNKYWLYNDTPDAFGGFPTTTLANRDSFFGTGFNVGTHYGRLMGSTAFTWGGSNKLYSGLSSLFATNLTSLGNPFGAGTRVEVGDVDALYKSCVISGDYIFAFRSTGYLQIWDKSNMNIPSGISPILVSNTNLSFIADSQMSGYPSDDWDGNNGLCGT